MGEFIDGAAVILVLAFLGFLVWSEIKKQSMRETLKEIKELISEMGPKPEQ